MAMAQRKASELGLKSELDGMSQVAFGSPVV